MARRVVIQNMKELGNIEIKKLVLALEAAAVEPALGS